MFYASGADGAVKDTEYYYTSSWYYLGEFWKYDKEGTTSSSSASR